MSKFKVGDRVYCHLYVEFATVTEISKKKIKYPVTIKYDDGIYDICTKSGRYFLPSKRRLYTLKEALKKDLITREQYDAEVNE